MNQPVTVNLTARPQIIHFSEEQGKFHAKMYDERGNNDLRRLKVAMIQNELEKKGIFLHLDQGMKGETIVTIEGQRPTEQIRTEVLDELANSYLSGFAQMWRGLSNSALCTCTVIWISGLRTKFTAPRDTTMQDIQLAWKFANQWFGTDGELRFVVQGSRSCRRSAWAKLARRI